MGFWSSETHSTSDGHGGHGTRRHKPHSKRGWFSNRDSEATAPLKTETTTEAGWFFATGRKKKS